MKAELDGLANIGPGHSPLSNEGIWVDLFLAFFLCFDFIGWAKCLYAFQKDVVKRSFHIWSAVVKIKLPDMIFG